MALLLEERSQSFRMGSHDEPSAYSVAYTLTDTVNGRLDLPAAVASMQSAATLPKVGDVLGGTFDAAVLAKTMRLRRIVTDQSNRTPNQAGLTLEYDTLYAWRGDIEAPRLVPRRFVTYSTVPRQLYRSLSDCTLPTGPTAIATDIGGTKLDEGGAPLVQSAPQATVQLVYSVDSTQTALATLDSQARSNQGKLCSVAFLAWPAYSLLLQSATLTPERDEYWAFSLTLLWDGLFHWQQRPVREFDGRIKLATAKAAEVLWKRDYLSADFSALFGLDAWGRSRLEKGEGA